MAPFGSHAFNVAAITAAICTGKESHEEAGKRYIAGLALLGQPCHGTGRFARA
jgi:benzoate membrane transport protein